MCVCVCVLRSSVRVDGVGCLVRGKEGHLHLINTFLIFRRLKKSVIQDALAGLLGLGLLKEASGGFDEWRLSENRKRFSKKSKKRSRKAIFFLLPLSLVGRDGI